MAYYKPGRDKKSIDAGRSPARAPALPRPRCLRVHARRGLPGHLALGRGRRVLRALGRRPPRRGRRDRPRGDGRVSPGGRRSRPGRGRPERVGVRVRPRHAPRLRAPGRLRRPGDAHHEGPPARQRPRRTGPARERGRDGPGRLARRRGPAAGPGPLSRERRLGSARADDRPVAVRARHGAERLGHGLRRARLLLGRARGPRRVGRGLGPAERVRTDRPGPRRRARRGPEPRGGRDRPRPGRTRRRRPLGGVARARPASRGRGRGPVHGDRRGRARPVPARPREVHGRRRPVDARHDRELEAGRVPAGGPAGEPGLGRRARRPAGRRVLRRGLRDRPRRARRPPGDDREARCDRDAVGPGVRPALHARAVQRTPRSRPCSRPTRPTRSRP